MEEKIGLIGLGVMGRMLALNIEEQGYGVAVYNRTASHTENFVKNEAAGKRIEACYSYEELVETLPEPRLILVMVKAGKAIDNIIRDLEPLLNRGDTIIDGGNSHFRDTERRNKELFEAGIHYIGMGISGGEEGARHGPSLMPGGQEESYRNVKNILEAAAAQADGSPCVAYVGERGAGHFVKMVHNGIEYAIMQAIAEVFEIMKSGLGLSYKEIHSHFSKWAAGERLGGYLMEISSEIMGSTDEKTGSPKVDVILDTAEHKGTGKWTSVSAYELGVPVHGISSALLARIVSAYREDRRDASRVLHYEAAESGIGAEDLEKALYTAVVLAYAQGFNLIQKANEEFDYGISPREVARIWRGGCIIRSRLLYRIMEAYEENPELGNLGMSKQFAGELNESSRGLRETVKGSADMGIAVPVLAHQLAYFDSLRKERLETASLIQAMRDYFGSHSYRRVDEEGVFHTLWSGDGTEERWE